MRLINTAMVLLVACSMVVLNACAQRELPRVGTSEFGIKTHNPVIVTGTSDKSAQQQLLQECVPDNCDLRLSLSVRVNNSLNAAGEISADTIHFNNAGRVVIAGESNLSFQVPAWNTTAAQIPLAPVIYTVTQIDAELIQDLLSLIPQDALYLALPGLSVEATFRLDPSGHATTEYVHRLSPMQIPLVDQ